LPHHASEKPSAVDARTAPAPDQAAPDDELLAAARSARERAYVPYSDFEMGAAVRTRAGDVVPGALVENVSLGLAMCAERAAMFATVAQGTRPTELALVARRTAGELTWPCGACLQVALELGGPDLTVHVADLDGASASARVGDLLPRGPHRPDVAGS
jgi:cytidine deaminase